MLQIHAKGFLTPYVGMACHGLDVDLQRTRT